MLKIVCFIKSVRGSGHCHITGGVSVLACRDGEKTVFGRDEKSGPPEAEEIPKHERLSNKIIRFSRLMSV
jgi:hypothetical protein